MTVGIIVATLAAIAWAVLASFVISALLPLFPMLAWVLVPAMLIGSALLWVAVLNIVGKR